MSDSAPPWPNGAAATAATAANAMPAVDIKVDVQDRQPPTISFTVDIAGWVSKWTGPASEPLCPVVVSIIVALFAPPLGHYLSRPGDFQSPSFIGVTLVFILPWVFVGLPFWGLGLPFLGALGNLLAL